MTTLFQITAIRSRHTRHFLFGFLLLFGLLGCKSTSMFQDSETVKQLTALKTEALNLMSKGTESYAKHKTAAQALLSKANELYEKQKKRENNTLIVQQFRLLLEDDGAAGTSGILTGFFKEWENASTPLTKFFVTEKKDKVAQAFDEILKLEKAKPIKK